MKNVHDITKEFEKMLSDYTGAPYVVCVDNASNALFAGLMYNNIKGKTIRIPARTYPSVPCEIILAGGKVYFVKGEGTTLKGEYQLSPTNVWDSALRFTADMYRPGQMQCISFTGAYKHFKLSKGGAILLDDEKAYEWLKRFRNSGRGECSYHEDTFTMIGRNCYMMPEVATRGVLLMAQFYNSDGSKKENADLELPYPDLSLHPAYK